MGSVRTGSLRIGSFRTEASFIPPFEPLPRTRKPPPTGGAVAVTYTLSPPEKRGPRRRQLFLRTPRGELECADTGHQVVGSTAVANGVHRSGE
jgi:hypothetical protein